MARTWTSTILLTLAAVQAQEAETRERPSAPSMPVFGSMQAVGGGPIHQARLLPKDAWMAASVGPLRGRDGQAGETKLDELRETGLWDLATNMPLPPQVRAHLLSMVSRFTTESGLSIGEIGEIATSGWTFALLGPTVDESGVAASPVPNWLVVGDVGPQVQERLRGIFDALPGRTIASDAKIESESWDELVVYRASRPLPFVWALRDGLLIASSSDAELRAVVDRVLVGTDMVSGEASGLEQHFGYKEFCTDSAELMRRNDTLVSVWVDPKPFMRAARELLPVDGQPLARKVIDALQLGNIDAVGYTIRASGGLLHDRVRVTWKMPRSGVLAAFVPEGDPITESLSAIAPPSTQSYFLTQVSLPALWEAGFTLAALIDSDAADRARAMVRRTEETSGFSVQLDILENLSKQFVLMQVPVENGVAANVLAVGLRDGIAFDRVIGSFGLEPETRDGLNVYTIPLAATAGGEGLQLGIANDRLVLTDSTAALSAVSQLLRSKEPNTTIAPVLAALPEGTISVGWTNLGELAGAAFALGGGAGIDLAISPAQLQTVFERYGSKLGELRSTIQTDARGISFETHSPAGHLLGSALLVAGASVGEAFKALGIGPDLEEIRRQQDDTMHAALAEVLAAAKARIQGGDAPANLQELDLGLGDPSAAAECIERYDYRFRLLTPEGWQGSVDELACLAWPSHADAGIAYAIQTDGSVWSNELLLGVRGVEVLAVADLFRAGAFGGELTPGWRPVRATSESEAPEAVGKRGTRDEDRKLYTELLRAEDKKGQLLPGDIVAALAYDDPRIVARAAFVAGKQQIKDAVPALAELVSGEADLAVRRQAMQALVQLRDSRSVPASITALEDKDEKVRALAARNLGRLRNATGRDGLLTTVAHSVDGSEGLDRVEALVALADLGDPSVLGAAALSISDPNKKLEEALTYTFQTLSPKLQPEEEATALVDVLDHDSQVLRRYALQRLAELGLPSTAKAIERQLAKEGPELRPLVEVTLASVRDDYSARNTTDFMGRLTAAQERVASAWAGLDQQQQYIALGSGAGVLLLALFGFWQMRRRSRDRDSEQWASMVAPSEELEYGDEDAAYDEDVYDDAEYDPDADGEYDDGEYDDGEYDEAYDDAEYEEETR